MPVKGGHHGKDKTDGEAYYHLMSRTNDSLFLFEKGAVKTELVAAGFEATLRDEQDRLRARMHDIIRPAEA